MTIKDRIKILIKYFCNGKKSNFAQMIGVTPSVVSNITGKRNGNPSFEVIHKILSAYPEINPEWFIMGTGEMIKESLDKNQGCPFYQTDLSDLSELLINNKPILPNYYINYPPYNKKGIFWCQVIGRSMEPEISHNDVIALMPMSTSINILPQGEIYAIITDNYITVKRIKISEREGFVHLIPVNKEYQQQEIPISMIKKVYAVIGTIHKLLF